MFRISLTSRCHRLACVLIIAVTSCPALSHACLWDNDTLEMERQRFPDALELITGKFLRHSEEYYMWRVRDRLKKLKSLPDDLKLQDDLAVAYDKLGKHEEAIEIATKQLKYHPKRYETQANLGTFYVHSGQMEKGLEHIQLAIQINPDAHFGREVYQEKLVRYVLAKRQQLPPDTMPFPMDGARRIGGEFVRDKPIGFAQFVLDELPPNTPSAQKNEHIQNATKGVLGMMRFGNFDSVVLLEVLGDLLIYGSPSDNKNLAVRAYLKAGIEAKDIKIQVEYRKVAGQALVTQAESKSRSRQLSLPVVERTLKEEIKKGKDFFSEIRTNERRWIAARKNVDAMFWSTYGQKSPNDVSPAKSLKKSFSK